MEKRFQVNDLIGEYRVTSFLGEGGMGEVYLGIHEKLGRHAAIKVLHATVTDPGFKTRFFNEARLQASLHHPNIATLYDFQEQNDQLFIFMEYVDGESLEDLITRRAFSTDETLSVFAAICEAVGYIHRNGVVHRDIKSQNVKLTRDGVVKLLDFGIAKDATSHGLTQTGGVIGTPNYLSPEQLEGTPATPQADVWALGVLFYEMLTGTLPFKGDTLPGLVLRITTAEFTAPEAINPAISRDASNIVKKCLKKDRTRRYLTADELLKAITAAQGARSKTATAHLGRTFGFRTADNPNLIATAVVADDHGAAGHRPVARRSPVVMIAGIGAVVFMIAIAAAGLGIWSYVGSPGPAQTSVSPKSNASSAPARTTGTQRVRVDIDEGKAQVLRNGELLGTTPLDMDLAVGENPSITLHRDGFEDKSVQIEVGSGKKVFTFSLKPKG